MSGSSGTTSPDGDPTGSDLGEMAVVASSVPAPLVTVIMPVHNGAAFIDEAIASIRTQTLPDWELLVIDDGSSDDSAARVQRHAAQDARICLIQQPKQGVAHALNRGMDEARAPSCCGERPQNRQHEGQRPVAQLEGHGNARTQARQADGPFG